MASSCVVGWSSVLPSLCALSFLSLSSSRFTSAGVMDSSASSGGAALALLLDAPEGALIQNTQTGRDTRTVGGGKKEKH